MARRNLADSPVSRAMAADARMHTACDTRQRGAAHHDTR
jgi:hypothetical protein